MNCFEELKAFMSVEHRCPKRGENKLNTWCNTQRQAWKKDFYLKKGPVARFDRIQMGAGSGFALDGELAAGACLLQKT